MKSVLTSYFIFFADFRFLGFIRVEDTAEGIVFKLESEHHNDESVGIFFSCLDAAIMGDNVAAAAACRSAVLISSRIWCWR